MRQVLVITILAMSSACGGAKPVDTTPDRPAPETTAPETSGPNAMFSPEVVDQIQRALDRKRDAAARCLSEAIDNKELPHAAHGKVVLEIVVAPSGTASSIRVIKSDLDSKTLTDCVTRRVHEIQFPTVPRPYERSYTYGFEAS